MKDMMISEGEKRENSVLSVVDDKPSYPYGLRITLDPDTIKKLEMKEAPEIGAKMMIHGYAEVIAVNKIEGRGDVDSFTVELQIQNFDAKEESKESKASNMLYGSDY